MKDFILRKPVNKTAALVTSSGFSFDPSKTFENVFKDIPPVKECPAGTGYLGSAFGRITVIGFLDCQRKNKPKYVCRCSCGNYLISKPQRIGAALKDKALAERSMCDECDFLNYIKKSRAPTPPISKNNRSLKKSRKQESQ